MAYFKDAQGDWMTQPVGMVPSWRGWAQGPVGPSASYRMPPFGPPGPALRAEMAKMSGCGACGGLGVSEEEYEGAAEAEAISQMEPGTVSDQDTDTIPVDWAAEQEAARVTPSEMEQLAKQQKGGGMGTVLLLGLGAVALWMLFGRKARRNPCHRNAGRLAERRRRYAVGARARRRRAARKGWARRRRSR